MTAMMEAVGLRVAVAGRVRSHLFRTAPPIEIVRGVDLSLARGSALGLVGESGFGQDHARPDLGAPPPSERGAASVRRD